MIQIRINTGVWLLLLIINAGNVLYGQQQRPKKPITATKTTIIQTVPKQKKQTALYEQVKSKKNIVPPAKSANYTQTISGVNIDMVFIKAGTFTMGSPPSEVDRSDDEKQHQVTLSAFYMSKYEVTFDQYDAFCDAKGKEKPSDNGWGRGNRPVINVSWYDAVAYCEWLSNETGKTYRLPTEAEWEYACRAGTTTPFNTGYNLTTAQANCEGQKTMPVGSFSANAWGLHDMHGNVLEWCSDWYSYYNISLQNNPKGPTTAQPFRVFRGGGWNNYANYCRSANRSPDTPDYRNFNVGFRLVSPK